MKLLRFALPALLLCSAMAATPGRAATFRWANDGDVNAMDPATRQETVQLSFLANIYEPLVRRNRTLGLEPALATSWEHISPTVWRFHLRPGVKWQDGSPFTADDVIFTLKRILAKDSSMRAPMSVVKEARKIDDLTVDFETFLPDPIFLQEQTNLLIMSKAWCEAHNATEPVVIGKEDNYALHYAMGTGPYKLVSREPDRKTVVEANPLWWDKRQGNADRVEFNVISSAPTRVAALLSGEMDMIYSVPPQDMARIKASPDLKILETPELRTIYLGFNFTRDALKTSDIKGKNPWRDIRVRQAVALAIDEQAITSRVMLGLGHPTWEMWGQGVNGYNAALDVRPKPDPAKAKQLLAEAGYPDGFKVTMDCPNDRYVMDEQICTAIVSMLARIGIKVDLLAQTKTKFFTKINGPNYDTDFFLLGWTPATYDAHNVLYTLLGTRNGKRGEVNDGGYSNPSLDDLIEKIGVETDQSKRDGLINQSIEILQKDLPTIPLHQQVIVWATKKNVSVAQPADDFFPFRFIQVK
ncbi:MAG TPA: ABC transporter substrate-binding protein [Rhodopila sp.]|uniref:ABC transporter substrate-binding protein n=1 Tax=Rhodopila sp. TaxID=2480087 RepID=UPI002B6040F8|nr:ABC transporter substrate-binding protein [Rhodopila sp.]HVY18364.1 ABC transporter substrate-binding protein [Rhodopila sp.]